MKILFDTSYLCSAMHIPLYTWYLLFCIADCLVCIPDSKYQCRINTVVPPEETFLVHILFLLG
jgi:hypothetical protein